MLEFDEKKIMEKFGSSNRILSHIIIDCDYSLIWGDHRKQISDFIESS